MPIATSAPAPSPILYIKAREVCRRLGGIHVATVRDYWRRGILPPPVKLGHNKQGRIMFDAAAVDAAVAAMRLNAATDRRWGART